MTKTGPLAETINNKNPGPGRYEPMKKIAKIGYTMRGKIIPPQPEAEKVPGPGSCKHSAKSDQDSKFFREDGNVFNSKYHNHKAALFNSGGSRFKAIEDENPGPGCYSSASTELNKAGKYSVSNLQSSKVRTFGHGIRQTFANRCQSNFDPMQLLDQGITNCLVSLGTTSTDPSMNACGRVGLRRHHDLISLTSIILYQICYNRRVLAHKGIEVK